MVRASVHCVTPWSRLAWNSDGDLYMMWDIWLRSIGPDGLISIRIPWLGRSVRVLKRIAFAGVVGRRDLIRRRRSGRMVEAGVPSTVLR